MTLPFIVVTGGPGSGKTTLLKHLHEVAGNRLAFVPEVATIVITAGVKPPKKGSTYREVVTFQQTIFSIQYALEHAVKEQAIREGKKLVVTDRGTMDNVAFLPPDADIFRHLNTTPEREYARYHAVVHLGAPSKDVYDRIKGNNPARSEDHESAVRIGAALYQVWSKHGRCITVANSNWEAVRDDATQAILEHLP